MRTFFIMNKVCPFFLLKAQKPLSPTIITDIDKVSGMFYICINTSNKRQIESFIDSLSDIGIVSNTVLRVGSIEPKCYYYEPHMKEPAL